MKSRIRNKLKTCNCGCGGTDPWHKTFYKRNVKQVSETEGTVRLPYSTQPVRVVRETFEVSGRTMFGMWTVDRDSVKFDKP